MAFPRPAIQTPKHPTNQPTNNRKKQIERAMGATTASKSKPQTGKKSKQTATKINLGQLWG